MTRWTLLGAILAAFCFSGSVLLTDGLGRRGLTLGLLVGMLSVLFFLTWLPLTDEHLGGNRHVKRLMVSVFSGLAMVPVLLAGFSVVPDYRALAGGILGSFLALEGLDRYRRRRSRPGDPEAPGLEKQVLIVGAGEAGEMLLREIKTHPALNRNVIGFVDDDPKKQGGRVGTNGVEVLGGTDRVARICRERKVDEVIIAMPSADGSIIRSVTKQADRINAELRIVPGIKKIIEGDVHWSQIRQVKPEDLLGRETVRIDDARVRQFLRGRTVLVTGAAGSIGSQLVQEILNHPVKGVHGLDQNESGLYELEESELNAPQRSRFQSRLGDVRDRRQIDALVERIQPDLLFHAAALKHVPMAERHPRETLKTNVLGTRNVFDAALNYGVRHCVLVSTDKAVYPKNVMGLSKRVGEYLVGSYQQRSDDCRFAGVRFGNVLGSRGSVVPLFKRQIEKGGPVTVTDPDVVRYFMTPTEAVRLLLMAASFDGEGTVYVLKMGDPIRILDLAHQLISLAGYEPETEIPVTFIGLREGEKMEEDLVADFEDPDGTDHSEILRVTAPALSNGEFERLETLLDSPPRTLRGVRRSLKSLVR